MIKWSTDPSNTCTINSQITGGEEIIEINLCCCNLKIKIFELLSEIDATLDTLENLMDKILDFEADQKKNKKYFEELDEKLTFKTKCLEVKMSEDFLKNKDVFYPKIRSEEYPIRKEFGGSMKTPQFNNDIEKSECIEELLQIVDCKAEVKVSDLKNLIIQNINKITKKKDNFQGIIENLGDVGVVAERMFDVFKTGEIDKKVKEIGELKNCAKKCSSEKDESFVNKEKNLFKIPDEISDNLIMSKIKNNEFRVPIDINTPRIKFEEFIKNKDIIKDLEIGIKNYIKIIEDSEKEFEGEVNPFTELLENLEYERGQLLRPEEINKDCSKQPIILEEEKCQ